MARATVENMKELVLKLVGGEWLTVDQMTDKLLKERPTLYEGNFENARAAVYRAAKDLELSGKLKIQKMKGSRTLIYGQGTKEEGQERARTSLTMKDIENPEILQLKLDLQKARIAEQNALNRATHWYNKYQERDKQFNEVCNLIHQASEQIKAYDDRVINLEMGNSGGQSQVTQFRNAG